MHVSSTAHSPSVPHQSVEPKGTKTTTWSSLLGRVTPSLKKTLLITNVVVITGIAYAFFLNRPFIMFGLITYGIVFTILTNKVNKASYSDSRAKSLHTQLKKAKTKNAALAKDLKGEKAKNTELTNKLDKVRAAKETLQELKKQQTILERRTKGLQATNGDLASRRDRLKKEVAGLKTRVKV